jgi:restriction system protein
VCQISRNNAEARIQALLAAPAGMVTEATGPVVPSTVIEPEEAADVPVDVAEISRDQIRRQLADKFPGHDFARLIGELLRGEGFACEKSPAGPDGGVDVLAGQGGMGFDGVTQAVQVKAELNSALRDEGDPPDVSKLLPGRAVQARRALRPLRLKPPTYRTTRSKTSR